LNPLWILAGVPALFVLVVVVSSALLAGEKRRIGRVGRRLAAERASDTSDSFADELQRSGIPRDVSLPLYAEMGRVLEVYGLYSFPARADDGLRTVYDLWLPDERNDLADADLRDIANGAAKRSGRCVSVVGKELDTQLAPLRTVRDLGLWVSSLPKSASHD
jgi:hypothetical protein